MEEKANYVKRTQRDYSMYLQLNKNKVFMQYETKLKPYENAVTERINGVLKQEFMIDKIQSKNRNYAKKNVREAISIYNEIRPYYSNYMLTRIRCTLRI